MSAAPTVPPPAARPLRAIAAWIAVAASALGIALALAPAADAQGGSSTVSEGAERGALLYSQQCAQCHGAAGAGGATSGMEQWGGEAPALVPDENPNVTAAYLDLVMATGRMPPAESPYDNRKREVVFSAEEREDLIAYMQQEFGVEGELPDVGGGDAAAGQEVWSQNCTHCHGATGAGGVAGAGAWTPQVNDRTAEEIAEATRVGPFNMPAFENDQITNQEIADVVAFMELVREEPRTPLTNLLELNPVFASGFVFLLALALLLAIRQVGAKPAWFPDPGSQGAHGRVVSGARRRGAADHEGGEAPAGAPRAERHDLERQDLERQDPARPDGGAPRLTDDGTDSS